MKVDTISDSTEKQIVIGLIISKEYADKIVPIINTKLFDSKYSKVIADWCIEYYNEYKDIPGINIKSIYRDKSQKIRNKDTKKMIQTFLKKLDQKYLATGFNVDYVIKRSLRYLRKQKMLVDIRSINSFLEDGKIDEAEEIWSKGISIPDYADLGFDPLSTKNIIEAFDREERYRVNIGTGITALDKIAGNTKSGWLCVYMAPSKRGKTFALWHSAINALMNNLNVVFISFETDEIDNAFRFWAGVGSLSFFERKRLQFPQFSSRKNTKVQRLKRRRPLVTRTNVKKEIRSIQKMYTSNIRIKNFPMNGATVRDIESYIDNLERTEDFTVQVIVVDYIGIIKAPTGITGRDVYDINTQLLKGLGQKKEAVVFTGHQSNRKSWEVEVLKATDASEDIRVINNSDIVYVINQTPEEKKYFINRLGVVAHRHNHFAIGKQAKNLIQLQAGQFSLDSRVINYGEKLKDKKRELIK